MYLSKIEIFGFKSFANKTVINLNRGVTGIVGPNGCGKSNIVDALRWVVGEQRASVLRSDKMEAVIFNGTKDKKPLGMAEVSLTIVNDRGLLPSEYSEITITRRIYRSGESEYLLNKNVCRYKDIVNLFMDTGLSSNAYSVIELKMIEAVIGNKADERRAMFEEAAGISKFKLRKRLTLKKLEEVRNDLTRVDDIISEVQRKVSSLEKQAKKADKYHNLKNELKEKEISLAEHEFVFYHNKKQSILIEREFDTRERERLEQEINTLDEQIADDRDKVDEIESEISYLKSDIAQLTEKIYKIEQQISVNEERKKSIENNIRRIENEIEELNADIDYNNDLIDDLNIKIANTNDQIEKLISQENELEEKLNSLQIDFQTKKNSLQTLRQANLNIIKDKNTLENKLVSLEKNLKHNQTELEKLNNDLQLNNNKLNELQNQLSENEDYKLKLEKDLEKYNSDIIESNNQLSLIKDKLDELKLEKNSQSIELKNIKDKVNFINQVIALSTQLNPANEFLLKSNNFSGNILNSIVEISEGYEAALQSILKFAFNSIVLDDISTLIEINNILKEQDLGKAELLLNNLPENKPNFLLKIITNYYNKKTLKNIQQENSFKGFAIDFIKSDNVYLQLISKLLDKFIVVDTFNDAIELFRKYPEFNFVTLTGDLILNNGFIITGKEIKEEDTLQGNLKLLDETLKNENIITTRITQIEQEIEELNIKLSQSNKNHKELEHTLQKTRDELQSVIIKINQIKNNISNTEEKIKNITNRINKISSNAESTQAEIENIKEQLNAFIEQGIDEENIRNLENEISELEDEIKKLNQNINQIKIQKEKSTSILNSYEDQLVRANDEIQEAKDNIANYQEELENLNNELISIENSTEDNYAYLDELVDKKNTLIQKENELNDSIKDLKVKVHEFDNKIRAMRKEKDSISDRLRDYDIKLNQIDMQVKNLVENIKLDYNIDLTYKELDDLETYDFDTITEEVFKLKQDLKNLGPVNTLAYEEYEEEKQRLDYMLNQRNDLIQSEKDLLQTIEEINTTATQQFLETFEQIRKNFIEIFRTLFNPGDEADLRLEEGVDPLEAKIEIIAKPKGKRPTVISLLSGGEKTLTATALLFAIYMIKPSPYCVMDEVDAPLDDANVGRFTKLIHEFKDKTQFIIVTHNKKTMEAAEIMYGVTMQEEGISKLVSVQFGNELKVVNN